MLALTTKSQEKVRKLNCSFSVSEIEIKSNDVDIKEKEAYKGPGSVLFENKFLKEELHLLDSESEVIWWHLCCSRGDKMPCADSIPFPFF